jgi:hypothetical protein
MLDKLCDKHWGISQIGETASHVGTGRDRHGRFLCDVCEVLERVAKHERKERAAIKRAERQHGLVEPPKSINL